MGNTGMDTKERALYLHFISAAVLVTFHVDSPATLRTDPAWIAKSGEEAAINLATSSVDGKARFCTPLDKWVHK